MDWRLDKDCNPIWLCKAAGVLYPSFLLLFGVVWAGVHRGRNAADWAVIGWCSFMLLVFWLRYRSGKVASLGSEFLFGSFLTCGALIALPIQRHEREWSLIGYFGLCFISAAIKYVRVFYFPPKKSPQQQGIRSSH